MVCRGYEFLAVRSWFHLVFSIGFIVHCFAQFFWSSSFCQCLFQISPQFPLTLYPSAAVVVVSLAKGGSVARKRVHDTRDQKVTNDGTGGNLQGSAAGWRRRRRSLGGRGGHQEAVSMLEGEDKDRNGRNQRITSSGRRGNRRS
jgi:hypothetical protein